MKITGIYMNLLDVQNLLIPGYSALNTEIRALFELSEAGKQLVKSAQKLYQERTITSTIKSIVEALLFETNTLGAQFKEKLAEEKNALTLRIQESPEYTVLMDEITAAAVAICLPDFKFLSEAYQQYLKNTTFSKALHPAFLSNTPELQQEFFKQWQQDFLADSLNPSLLHEIKERKKEPKKQALREQLVTFKRNLKQLGVIFPLLNTQASSTLLSEILDSYEKYIQTNPEKELQLTVETIEINLLAMLIRSYLNQTTKHPLIDLLDLEQFNLDQACLMAKKILDGYKHKNQLNIENIIKAYTLNLTAHIEEQILYIKGKKWKQKPYSLGGLKNSLTSIFWENESTQAVKSNLDKLSEANAFLVNFGLSPQNDNIVSAFLELYNTYRIKDSVNDSKGILLTLVGSVNPLYQEYKDIAFNETNFFRALIRTLIPILIIIGMVIAISVALTPIAIPEVALAFILIPAIVIGIEMASGYVYVKNACFNSISELYHGGQYETPGFQVNQRMCLIFGSQKQAEAIRSYYISELSLCDTIEKQYANTLSLGLLNSVEKLDQEENAKRKTMLQAEWFDIHTNNKLPVDLVPQITFNRINADWDKELKIINDAWQQTESAKVTECVTEVGDALSEILLKAHPTPDTSTNSKTHYSSGFFKPDFVTHREKALQLGSLFEERTPTSTCMRP